MTETVLMVLTSHDRLGETGNPTGFYWEELAVPYWALRDAGYEVEIASISGGAAPIDPGSAGDKVPEPVTRFQNDPGAMTALERTRPIADVDPSFYVGIFLPGGHGTMWDFAQSPALAGTITRAWAEGAVVGAVCHGPAGLTEARATDGQPLVAGRRVNGFTNAEEDAAGLTHVVPYLLESRLRDKGGVFEANPEPFGAYAVRDGRLVTGQNPASASKVAELLLEALAERRAAA